MKILKSWLKDYIDFDLSNEKLAELLSLSGTAVDSYTETFDKNVIVAEIKAVVKHPNADKLQIATVWNGHENLQIVCGAPNIAVGQKVPLAQIGAALGTDFVIKQAVIRGTESFGMLCADDELGLSSDHEGIKILPDEYEVGQSLSHYIEPDALFEIEITPNRGDTLSHLGVARELSALLKKEYIKHEIKSDFLPQNLPALDIEVKSTDCKQYFGLQIDNIKVGESPDWLKERLIKLGAKPINNVVDVTNYIMLDLGQPLHAFDADKVEEGIIVRKADADERIIALDNHDYALNENILVIADHKKPIAIAGVMGGVNSEVDRGTVSIILESAEFEPRNIRKTAKDLNLSTDASYRFERGIDSCGLEYAIARAAELVLQTTGGKIASDATFIGEAEKSTSIEIEHDKINKLLGLKIEKEEIDSILVSLGFEIEGKKVIAPSWRHDISIWQDLAEEIARIIGYNNVPFEDIPKTAVPIKSPYYYKEFLKDILIKNGFSEVMSYAFLNEADLKTIGLDSSDLLEIINPVSPENRFLRKSIIPNLLKIVAKNPTFDQVFVFEIGHAFTKTTEKVYLSIATSGKNAKNTIETAVKEISEISDIDPELFNIQEMSADTLSRFKIKKPFAYVAEIDVELIVKGLIDKKIDPSFEISDKKVYYREISRFPALTRDLAFIVDADQNSHKISDAIYEVSPLINRVELFDEFASDKFGINKKNVAFHLYLQHLERTLTDKEANDVVKDIIDKVSDKFDAKLRD